VLELRTARTAFERLGARLDLERTRQRMADFIPPTGKH